ncbi:hypothetical protein [Cytobacillus oceanisediminis]|jgi:hypothetical protein|uniref:hypothetical protein n=1 Tax=Cytobacillus oceanisediminis TaxID=665099 RepID=UPI00203E37B4|nr:hypothetical protein [Cytobacillus oceanisediminis]MCM3406067.1 hypothetical protein [Cytobacillus oceanisediminis]
MSNTVRVIIQVSESLNEQLVEESERLGLAKTAIVTVALEQYFSQKQAMRAMSDIGQVIQKLEDLEKRIDKQ